MGSADSVCLDQRLLRGSPRQSRPPPKACPPVQIGQHSTQVAHHLDIRMPLNGCAFSSHRHQYRWRLHRLLHPDRGRLDRSNLGRRARDSALVGSVLPCVRAEGSAARTTGGREQAGGRRASADPAFGTLSQAQSGPRSRTDCLIRSCSGSRDRHST